MPAKTQIVSQHVLSEHLTWQRAQPATKWNVSQNVLINSITWQRGHKMYLIMCWTFSSCLWGPIRWLNPSHVSEDRKWISSWQTHPMPARAKIYPILCWPNSEDTKYTSTKPLPGHKIYLNMLWANQSHAFEDTKYISSKIIRYRRGTKCISLYGDQTITTQNLNKWWTRPLHNSKDKVYLNMCWTIHSLASVDPNYMRWPNPSLTSEDRN